MSLTWVELERRVAGFAGGLVAAGVRPGETVALVLPNGVEYAVAFWGVLRASGVVLPVNPGYTPRETGFMLADAGARCVVAPAGYAATVPRLDPDLAGAPVDAADVGPDDLAVLCYTSGTTGRPKGARLLHRNLLGNLESFGNLPLLTLDAGDLLLGVLPFFHVFGLNVVLNAAALAGAGVLALPGFSPAACLAAMAEHGVSVAYGAPPVFAALAAAPPPPLPRLRAAISGADALPVPVGQRFAERFGVELLEGYGLTEASPVVASNAACAAPRLGTVGMPIPGVEVRLLDPAGHEVAAGQTGEITVDGPGVFAGYHGAPEATAEVLQDGWLRTGDLGTFDADGYLRIAGRLKDLIIVSGFNVYPREVEDVLGEHPDVAEAAVVGVPDARTGERVRAVVVARRGSNLTAEALQRHCRARLARYKQPREIELVDALPRMATGKVSRAALRR